MSGRREAGPRRPVAGRGGRLAVRVSGASAAACNAMKSSWEACAKRGIPLPSRWSIFCWPGSLVPAPGTLVVQVSRPTAAVCGTGFPVAASCRDSALQAVSQIHRSDASVCQRRDRSKEYPAPELVPQHGAAGSAPHACTLPLILHHPLIVARHRATPGDRSTAQLPFHSVNLYFRPPVPCHACP